MSNSATYTITASTGSTATIPAKPFRDEVILRCSGSKIVYWSLNETAVYGTGSYMGPDDTLILTGKKANAAFMKPVTPDDKLAAVVGSKPLPRTELTKKLWVYIKKNNLQDPKKKTVIVADAALKAVFNGKKSVTMFEMTKLVSGHVS